MIKRGVNNEDSRKAVYMKLVIASDLHGSADAVRTLEKRIEAESPDRIVLLGDLLYHGPRNDLPADYAPKEVAAILNNMASQIIAVRGNCDAEVDQMVLAFPCMNDYALMVDGAYTLYLTHGHIDGMTPDVLPPLPMNAAFLSGHTHIKTLTWVKRSAQDAMNAQEVSRVQETTHAQKAAHLPNVLLVNPGSTSIPKDGSASYAVYEQGVFTLKTLEGKPLQQEGWAQER